MNITESIVKIIEKDGIVLQDRIDVYNSIDGAIAGGRFEFVDIDGIRKGFFTYEFVSPTHVFINNLFIERKYRGSFSLMWGIRFLRNKYPGLGATSWKSRKKNKIIRFEKKETLCS